jgi:glycosyltransferase involved in cell wall biosynthesis
VCELRDRLATLHVLLVGEEAEHYDARTDAAQSGVADRIHITGYVADADLPAYLAAADICSCLRWPTNRETSASWLRCLAAGNPTLVSALAQHVGLPEIAVTVDVLDEERALPLAIESLALDAASRARLGAAAREYWGGHHRLEQMAAGYERLIARALSLPAPQPALPAHISNNGSEVMRRIAEEIGVTARLADILD